MTRWLLRGLLAVGACGAASMTWAGGPRILAIDGTPYVWRADPISFNPDRGNLGMLDDAEAVATVESTFAAWTAVPTALLHVVNAGSMPVDVTGHNFANFLFVCGDGLNPIVFDDTGQITEAVFGAGGRNDIAGFASAGCLASDPPTITEAFAVLNGRMIDGVSTENNFELPLAQFTGVFAHEFGHFLGLTHSLVGDVAEPESFATMTPFVKPGSDTLAFDDRVAISTLYPAPTFGTDFGAITGQVVLQDGVTAFQGAWVTARHVDDPLLTAVGVASGARFAYPGVSPPTLQGLFEIPGLPPGSYTVEINEIPANVTGGSSVGPFVPPRLPGPPEFWNGLSEASTLPPDDPTQSVPVAVAAGVTESGVDIVINEKLPPPNDDCANAKDALFDFVDTAVATTEPSDPLQSCSPGGASQNTRSVWYRFTPPADGTMTVSAAASEYPTVVTAYTGSCGSLTEQACREPDGSAFILPVSAGTTYRFEVTALPGTTGERLGYGLNYFAANPLCSGGAPIASARLAVTNLEVPAGDEDLVVSGRIRLAPDSPVVFDPATTGAQVLVEEVPFGSPDFFTVFELSHRTTPIPGGGPGTGCGPTDGWVQVGSIALYRNRSNALPPACEPGSANGLVSLRFLDRRARYGSIRFRLRTRTSVVSAPKEVPRITVVFGAMAADGLSGNCGERYLNVFRACVPRGSGNIECRAR